MIGPVSNDTSAVVMVCTYIPEKRTGFLQKRSFKIFIIYHKTFLEPNIYCNYLLS